MNRTAFITSLVLAIAAAAAPAPHWRNIGPGGGGWIQSICASPHDIDELFVGCDVGGFYYSATGGASYTIHNTGLADYFVECIAPHPANRDVIYIGCQSGVYKSTDRGRTWQWLRNGFPAKSRGRWTAPIGALAIDPQSPDTLYAGIGRPRRYTFGKGAIYKTTDAGASWSQVNKPGSLPDDAWITDLLIHPNDSRHLYAACQYGVYQSRDAGATWQPTIAGLPHKHVRRLALCKQQPNVMYATLRSPPGQSPWQGGVYRSNDGGNTWAARNNGLKQYVGKPGQPAPMTANYDRIVAHPTNPDIVYVGGTGWVNATMYKTTDGGKTWRDIVRRTGDNANIDRGWIAFWGPTVKCLTLSPVDPDVLYFGTSGAVFKTTNGGESWQNAYSKTLPDGRFHGTGLEVTCLHNLVVHPKDPKRLYLGYYDIGLLISYDGGETFRRGIEGVPRLVQNSCLGVVFAPDNGDHCWASFGQWGANKGMIGESTDAGFTWKMVGTKAAGLPEVRHRVLILDAATRHLFTTCDGEGVYASEDGGRSWQPRSTGLPHGDIRALVQHPAQPATFWCVLGHAGKKTLAAVYRSDDACKTWRQVSRGLDTADVKALAAAASDPHRLYLASRNIYLKGCVAPGGVFRSDDAGATWRRVLADDFVQGLAVDPRNADVVYAGLTDHPYHDESTGDGIVMTRDGGKTWANISGDLTCKHVSRIVIDPHDPDQLYLGTGGNGVFVGRVQIAP